MKIDFKSFLIGVLLTLVVVLFMGSTRKSEEVKLVVDKPIPVEIKGINNNYTVRISGKEYICIYSK